MKGVYNRDYCNVNNVLHQYFPVSAGLSEQQVAPSLLSAFSLFILPALGEQLALKMEGIAENKNPSRVESDVLGLCREAVANLAFWYHFTELNIRITDQGFQRQESDSFKSLYKYQETNLKDGFRNRGFNALDRLLSCLERNAFLFPEYHGSPAGKARKQAVVRSVAEIEQYYSINSSHLVFLRLQPLFRIMQDIQLRPLLGEKLYRVFVDFLQGNTESTDALEGLRKACVPFFVLSGIAELMGSPGSITDRGLYFTSIVATSGGDEETTTVDTGSKEYMIENTLQHANAYQQQLIRYIQLHLSEWYGGSPGNVFERDNTHKRTFFA